MNNTIIKPTTAAIETAITNSFKMHGNYNVIPFETGDLFTVQHKRNGKRCYSVSTIEGLERCSCPQFGEVGVCKHQHFVDQYRRIEAEEARMEAQAEAESLVYCN